MSRKIVDGIEYLSAIDAIKLLGCSKQSFYGNVKPHLRPHHLNGLKTPHYAKADIQAIASGKPNRKASIVISGMFANWTNHIRSLGYNAETHRTDVSIGYLPDDIASTFHLPANELFLKSARMTLVDGEPICSWDSHYPLNLVQEVIPQIQDDSLHDVVGYIERRHGVVVGKAKDRYSTRITTLDEINRFQLLNDEPVLLLQRVASTSDEQTLVLFSHMVLLGSWFVIEREEEFPVKGLA